MDVDLSRQESLVPESLLDKNILVIGCGAVGRNVVAALSRMGIKRVHVCDFDDVELHNCHSQGFFREDIGKLKVETLEKYQDLGTEIIYSSDRWRPDFEFFHYIFLCADCMSTRKAAFNYYRGRRRKGIIIDTRMRGEEFRTYVARDEESDENYEASLFTNEEADDASCSSVTTFYCSLMAAGHAVQRMVSIERDGYVPKQAVYSTMAHLNVVTP